MVKNIKLGLVFGSLILVVFMVFVIAASYDQSLTNVGNGTTITMLIFNVSDVGVGGTSLDNITIDLIGMASYGNITNVTVSDGTTTWYTENPSSDPFNVSIGSVISGQTNFTINFTLSSTATDALTLGFNVTHIYNETNVSYSALPYTSGIATIDSLKPYIEYGATATASDNLSQSYIFMNVSTNDTVSNLDTIVLYLYNSTGEQNSSTNASVDVTSAVQSYNFSGLSDGTYYINATVNDSYNHVNSSLVTRTITLDTVDPIASASCSPSSVSQNNVVTCTCGGSDGGSGINSSLTSVATTPSTASTGTYTVSACSVTDNAGNSDSASATYSVTGSSSSGGGSSSTTSFWTYGTHSVAKEQFASGFTKQLSVRQRIKVQINSEDHHVGVVELTATTATINISSDPQQVVLSVGDEEKFEVSGDDYYDILVRLNSIEDSKANVTIESINELVVIEEIDDDETVMTNIVDDIGDAVKGNENVVIWVIIGITIVGIGVGVFVLMKKKKSN